MCAERFAVYRNNVAVGLIEALRGAFPVVERLVGPEFFAAMARAHAFQSSSVLTRVLAYGSDFPDFIAGFEPAGALPYLADVARLEWHWLEAYHAAEAAPLSIADLWGVSRDRVPALRLQLHPSARFLSFAHPARSIWRLHQEAGELGRVELEEAREHVLLVRPRALVEAIDLSSGAVVFLDAIRADRPIGEAVAAALQTQASLDLFELLPLLFQAGTFAGFIDTQETTASGRGDHT